MVALLLAFADQPEVYLAAEPTTWIALISLAVSLALAVTQKKPKAAPLDDALQSTATRGSYIPLLIGRHRVGPIFAFVSDATNALTIDSGPGSQPGFGKGGGGVPDPGSYFENALHILAVGPGARLDAIYQNGETVWKGPITPSTHPSGSEFTIADQGTFKIYWGFKDDPILPSEVTDVASNYALTMKVVWLPKNLGQSRTWPRLEYEIECPCYSQIAGSASELPIEGNEALPTWESASIDPPIDAVAGNLPETKIQLAIHKIADIGGGQYAVMAVPKREQSQSPNWYPQRQKILEQFPIGSFIRLVVYSTSDPGGSGVGSEFPVLGTRVSPAAAGIDTAAVWKYFWIAESRVDTITIYASGASAYTYFHVLVLVLGPEVTGNYVYNPDPIVPFLPSIGFPAHPTQNMGMVEPLDTAGTDGVNPIHIVDQLLFARRPYGAGKDRSKFDPRSIEQAAVVMQSEKIRGNMAVRDGEGIESVLSTIMQDCGFFISWDPQTGLFVFKMLRYDDPSSVADLPKEMILKRPQMLSIRGGTAADVLAFTFRDRRRNYREEPLVIQDDGQVSLTETSRAKKIPIEVTTDYESAARMVPRRQQEALANQSVVSFETNHATQMAVAGNRIKATTTEGAGFVFRITSVKRDLNSPKVILDCLIDNYDPPPTDEENFSFLDEPSTGGLPRSSAAASHLAAFPALETPRMLANGALSVFFPAGRVSAKTSGAAIWGSRDGSSFSVLGTVNLAIVGTLNVDLPADGPCYDDGTYDTTPVSVDFDSIEDLSIDEDSWRAGRQLLIVGKEVCFLRGVTGDALDGLIRGRVGTLQAYHPAGTPFAIVLAHRAETLQSPMFVPGKTVSFKVQALEGSRTSLIDDIEPLDITLAGVAYTPLPVAAIRQASLRPDYSVSDDITIVWNWHSDRFARTGLGMQTCGAATGVSPVQGHFVFRIYDDADVLVAEGILTEPLLSLDTGDRGALGLDSLPFWTLEIQAVEGSFTSTETTAVFYPV